MATTTAQKAPPRPAQQQPQTQLAKATNGGTELASLIYEKKDAFALVAGKHFKVDRLVKLAQAALSRSQDLVKCTPGSILVALMRCAELGLEPDGALPTRRMWLVPRWNGKVNRLECTYVIDYRAQIQLLRDTGLVTSILASEVCRNDTFDLRYNADGASIAKFEFAPGGKGGVFAERGEVIGYFAAARLSGGEVQVVAMSKPATEKFRDVFAPRTKQGKIKGPWSEEKNFDAMALKTCLRKLWKFLPAGETEAQRKLQERLAEEEDVDAGERVVIPELGDVPDQGGDGETTAAEVERVLAGGQASAAAAATPSTTDDEPGPDEPRTDDADIDFK
jgi:recombination protein RecT